MDVLVSFTGSMLRFKTRVAWMKLTWYLRVFIFCYRRVGEDLVKKLVKKDHIIYGRV